MWESITAEQALGGGAVALVLGFAGRVLQVYTRKLNADLAAEQKQREAEEAAREEERKAEREERSAMFAKLLGDGVSGNAGALGELSKGLEELRAMAEASKAASAEAALHAEKAATEAAELREVVFALPCKDRRKSLPPSCPMVGLPAGLDERSEYDAQPG